MPASTFSAERLAAALAAIQAVANQVMSEAAPIAEEQMRANAPWNDGDARESVTGKNARQSLEAEASTDDPNTATLILRSTRENMRPWRGFAYAPVGLFLELGTRHMRPLAVIEPTAQQTAQQIVDSMRALLAPDL